MTEESRVCILIPVHNRKSVTLTCLEALQHQGDLERYQVVVIDDGSTDGTAEAIQASFPHVTILKGDGNLWWTGAIAKGMAYAYEQGADYFIWLNDDTLPRPNTLTLMVSACAAAPRQIITAQCYADNLFTQPTYGGRRVKGFSLQFLVAQPQETVDCDVCSGNLVCLPRSVVDSIGYPPSRQVPQSWGDVIYTWWAKQVGFQIIILGSAIAVCPTNPLEEGWSSSTIAMKKRWQQLRSPKSSIYPPAYWFYCFQIYGLRGIFPFVQVYLKLVLFTVLRWVIPVSWIAKVKKLKDERLKPSP
jgi:GT2 family glycosyltransferase